MKQKLLIISDLFGFENSSYIQEYVLELERVFEVVLFDAQELAGIANNNFTEQELHHQFVNGGIEKAVKKLLERELEIVNVLGFSIGGTIAWKAGLSGLKIDRLVTVSSTRLRKEVEKPKCSIHLLFAENDAYNPSKEWFKKLDVHPMIISGESHNFYSKQESVKLISGNFIINKLIDTYVSTKVVVIVEIALEKLMEYTNEYNHQIIIKSIKEHPNSSSDDVSIYISEVKELLN